MRARNGVGAGILAGSALDRVVKVNRATEVLGRVVADKRLREIMLGAGFASFERVMTTRYNRVFTGRPKPPLENPGPGLRSRTGPGSRRP